MIVCPTHNTARTHMGNTFGRGNSSPSVRRGNVVWHVRVRDLTALQDFARQVLQEAFEMLPGRTDEQRIQFCVDVLIVQVEALDNMMPMLAQYLDTPFVDGLQRALVQSFVQRVYDSWIKDDADDDADQADDDAEVDQAPQTPRPPAQPPIPAAVAAVD